MNPAAVSPAKLRHTSPGASLRIGLTGGIASGKSTVARLFAARGVPVIDTDQIARDVAAPGGAVLAQLVQTFGEDILTAQGTLDRARMRERAFVDAGSRHRLERILHPAIRAELERRSAAAGGPYQVLVIPLLVETGADYVDRVLVVDCSPETQLARLLARDAGGEAQARAMLAAQASRPQRLQRADEIIVNDGQDEDIVAALSPQVDRLHARYLSLST
jgi:dephospho-CoA kinase